MVNVSPPQIVSGLVAVIVGDAFTVAITAILGETHAPLTAST